MGANKMINASDIEHLYYSTRTMCPECGLLLPGEVKWLGDGVYVTRNCPDHGFIAGLVCSDRQWYETLPRFDVMPVKPVHPGKPVSRGCPEDCGLCAAHRQIAGTAAIEISNHCNSACPICLADNRGTFELSPDEIYTEVNRLLQKQGHVDVVTLSGGEPTIHPQLFKIIRMLESLDISRIVLNSNGVRIADDDGFLNELVRHSKVYVSLHHDGVRASEIRGTGFDVQEKALERLIKWNINSVPLVLAMRGINDGELGNIVSDLLTRSPSIKTIILSMMTFAGRGGFAFSADQEQRLTITCALDCIEQGSKGRIRKKDFIPLPMPNPLCAAIGYFLIEGNDITPIIPLAGVDRVVEFLSNSHFGKPDATFERFFRDVIDELYANADRIADAQNLLTKLRRLIDRMFPVGKSLSDDERRRISEESIKSVYLMQFMDGWTFDAIRTSKCSCQHLLPNGVVIPSCGYYSYHRKFNRRFSE